MVTTDRERLLREEQRTLAHVHEYLIGALSRRESISHTLREACLYAVGPQGKMIRPALMLEACRAVGGNPEQVLPAAAGTEYGHTASLIHDDLIDRDELRRGQESVYRRFGVDYAVLGGDYLIFQTYLSFTRCHALGVPSERVLRAIELLSETCLNMCEGQALEAELVGRTSVTVEEYFNVIECKTATFTSSAAEIGGVLGGGGIYETGALRKYGRNLGIAFQITDDVLPYVEDASVIRKPTNSDLANRRVTLPLIYALTMIDADDRQWMEQLFKEPHPDVAQHPQLVALIQRSGAIERCRTDAARAAALAQQELEILPPSSSRDLLSALADLAVDRHW
ncbi:MAG: polyprenyl synthetase family protein [Chloroflexi bacterium]|nr:polyprenyl synthetase family protein [Chloroflexota bacterium]